MTGGIGSTDAKALLDWIKRNRKASFRKAEVGEHLRRFRDNPRALEDALKALLSAGAIRPRQEPCDPSKRGPKPSPAYDVHPDLLRAPDDSANSDDSRPEDGADPIGGNGGNSWRSPESQEANGREVFEL
jgi:hypothetical protein